MADTDSDSDLSVVDETELKAMEAEVKETKKARGLDKWFKPSPKTKKKDIEPEIPKRAPSPPHEFVLADNDSIAFIVMFRSRFSEVFAKTLPHYGPQDIENGVGSARPDENVERLLCALLDLVLNRQKHVERGHYGRALEDAVSSHKNQWPKAWNYINPLSGGTTFESMTAEERLVVLKSLVIWALHSSDAVSAAIKGAYKQTRRDDDRNQPKAVQPWFSDTWRRKYYLIEGQDDTAFRIYRENDAKKAENNIWFSVAGSIDEAKALADKLETEMPGNQGKIVSDKIRMAVPRWEAGEEKRKKKEYRIARRAAFTRPEPGFSLYEGRTRGKRMRYTYDDDDDAEIDGESDATSMRKGESGTSTPLDEARPTVTASGRHVKSRLGGMYGESMLADQRREAEQERVAAQSELSNGDGTITLNANGRPLRGAAIPAKRAATASTRSRHYEGITSGSESDNDAPDEPSGDDWDGDENEPDEEESELEDFDNGHGESEDDLLNDAADASTTVGAGDNLEDNDETQDSLVVQLRYRKEPLRVNGDTSQPTTVRPPVSDMSDTSDVKAPTNGVNGEHSHSHSHSPRRETHPDVVSVDALKAKLQTTALSGHTTDVPVPPADDDMRTTIMMDTS